MLLTLFAPSGAVIEPPPVVIPPIPDVVRENYTGRYLVTANRLAPYLHGSVWKKNWKDSL